MREITKKKDILRILTNYDEMFQPSLSNRFKNLEVFAEKLKDNAFTFIVEEDNKEIGFISFYANDFEKKITYIVFIAVSPSFQGKKVGQALLEHCTRVSNQLSMEEIKLEVRKNNKSAIHFYKKNGFSTTEEASDNSYYMTKYIN